MIKPWHLDLSIMYKRTVGWPWFTVQTIMHAAIHLMQGTVKSTNIAFISCRALTNLQILHAVNVMHFRVYKYCMLSMSCISGSTNFACCQCHAFQGHSLIYKYCMLSMSCILGAKLNLQILHAVNIMHIRGTVKSTNIACCQCHAFQGHS